MDASGNYNGPQDMAHAALVLPASSSTDTQRIPAAIGPVNDCIGEASTFGVCRAKFCKKVDKTSEAGERLLTCSNDLCEHHVHQACLLRLLADFGADSTFASSVCGKRCYNAIIKRQEAQSSQPAAKKRVAWHDDGLTPSISSLSCVIDWLTSGNSYNRWLGGEGHQGETKQALAGEVVREIARSGITTARSVKDVITKIGNLESSYKEASDWLSGTGAGVENEPSIRSYVLKLCPCYYELADTMGNRPRVTPLLVNTDAAMLVSDDENEAEDTQESSASNAPSSRPLSIASPAAKRRRKTTQEPSRHDFSQLKETQLAQDREFEVRTLEFRQQEVGIQREDLTLRQQKAVFELKESEARAQKFQNEAQHWRIQATASLLRERHQLKNEGVPQNQIDLLLPLPTQL